MAEVPSDTIGRVRHTKPAHDINATSPPLSSLTPEDVACLLGEEEGSGASPDLDLAGRAAVVAARRLTAAPQPPFAMATVADMTAGQGSEAEVAAAERMLGQDSGDAGEGGVDGECGSLATLTTEPLVKPPLPIAIDGFIPNSTIRDLLGFKKPPAPPTLAATQWKPKQLRSVKKRKKVKKSERLPQEGADGEHVSSGASSSIESEGDPADVIMWASSSEDEIEEDDVDECAVSGPPTEDGKPIGFKIRKVNIRRVLYDPSWPTQPEDEGAIQPQQQESISGDAAEKLSSDLLLAEEAGDGILDTDVDDGIPLLLKEIALESWFPKELELTVSWVVKAFLQIMDFVGVGPHKHLCNYIVRLHTELELTPSELDSLIDHLMAQLTHKQARIRCNAVRTLGQLGMARSDVLAGIMPMLVDAQVDVREEATSTFVCLTGVSSKSELINYFGKIGVMKPYVNTEEEVLSALANKLQHQRSPEGHPSFPHDSALPSILWSSTEDAALPSATPDTFTPWILNDWVMKHFAPTSGQAASHQQMAQPAQRARQQRVRGGRNAAETGVGRSSARSGISRGVGRKSEFPTISDSSVLRKPQLARQAPPSREKSNKVPHRPARVAQKKTRVGRQTPSGRKDLSNIDGGGILEEVTDDHYKGEPAERGGSGLMPLPQLPTRTHDWENDHTSTRDRTRLLPTNKRLYRMFESQLESSTTVKIRAAEALLKPAQQPGGTSEPTSTLHSLSDMLRDSGYASGFLGSQQWASSDAGKDSSVGRATAADAAPGAGQENVISGEMWRPRLKLPQLVESLVEGATLKTFGRQDAAAQIGRDGGEGEGKERGEGQDGAMLSQKRRSQGEQSEKGGQSGVSGRSTNVDKHNSHKGRMQKIHGGMGQDTNEERGRERRGGRGQDTNEERRREKRGGRGQDTNEERRRERRGGGRGPDTNEKMADGRSVEDII
ncbi:PREDICTED: uncharacterized protein LOC106812817 [Priapulus caudatus]|uniref:Uncharacterized protein LOC106812817 n=1 Tax=Priapulus caudatus TaxID=37621 RepID=A0ABM1EJB6_PRICU|nr:PREDICTED: uncharacterized protein LOC106812817 [Priapulus caudatus]